VMSHTVLTSTAQHIEASTGTHHKEFTCSPTLKSNAMKQPCVHCQKGTRNGVLSTFCELKGCSNVSISLAALPTPEAWCAEYRSQFKGNVKMKWLSGTQ